MAGTDDKAWRAAIAPYTEANDLKAVLGILTSHVPYIALTVLMVLAADAGMWWAVPLLALPAAGFLVRVFIVFHDCGHGSYFRSDKANTWVGRISALMVFAAYGKWRHEHAVHHATAGDLERRGVGDLPTMTVDEYLDATPKQQTGYRLFRNPAIMFTLGPLWSMIISPRITDSSKRPRLNNSVKLTNVGLLVIVGLICWLIGPLYYLLIIFLPAMVAGAAGIWLFYVQHQFEDVYWQDSADWSYRAAALEGSSYLKLPRVLQFFSGNIGLHHVHHLSASVPNYRLEEAHNALDLFEDVPVLTLADGIRATRLKLYDTRGKRMIGWRELRAEHRTAAQAGTG